MILVAHTEDWTVDQLVNLPLDGFEMYNIHANLLRFLVSRLRAKDRELDLVLLVDEPRPER